MIIQRRAFLTGLASLLAAPAIVKASSLMPVKAIREPTNEEMMALLKQRMDEAYQVTRESMARILYGNPDFVPQRFTGFETIWVGEPGGINHWPYEKHPYHGLEIKI